MKRKRSTANNEVAKKCNEEYFVMSMPNAIEHPHDSEVDEDEICERVHHLGDVISQPVVFLTPVNRACVREPVAMFTCGRIWYRKHIAILERRSLVVETVFCFEGSASGIVDDRRG